MTAGMRPSFTSESAKAASYVATAMSQHATSPTPPPSAAPCTRAMVGLRRCAMVRMSAARPIASRRFSSSEKPAMRFIQFRSAPAENDLPAPESTTTRMPSSASIERNASVSSAMSASSKALWRSGRFMVTMPTEPCRSIARASLIRLVRGSSHAQDAEARLLGRCVGGDGKRQAQHAARIGGVDHAVVPEPRAGVVGMALPLVLLANGILEGLFLGFRPAFALGLEAVALHGGEHRGRLLAAHHRDARVGPGPEEARIERAPAHAVVAGAERAAQDHRQLRHSGARHGGHHLGAVLGDAARFVFLAHH